MWIPSCPRTLTIKRYLTIRSWLSSPVLGFAFLKPSHVQCMWCCKCVLRRSVTVQCCSNADPIIDALTWSMQDKVNGNCLGKLESKVASSQRAAKDLDATFRSSLDTCRIIHSWAVAVPCNGNVRIIQFVGLKKCYSQIFLSWHLGRSRNLAKSI